MDLATADGRRRAGTPPQGTKLTGVTGKASSKLTLAADRNQLEATPPDWRQRPVKGAGIGDLTAARLASERCAKQAGHVCGPETALNGSDPAEMSCGDGAVPRS